MVLRGGVAVRTLRASSHGNHPRACAHPESRAPDAGSWQGTVGVCLSGKTLSLSRLRPHRSIVAGVGVRFCMKVTSGGTLACQSAGRGLRGSVEPRSFFRKRH